MVCQSTPNNVHMRGAGERAMVFAHAFGCDHNMWRFVEPEFAEKFKTVLFDHVGAGGSNLTAYSNARYSTLAAYAGDIVKIGRELDLTDAIFVGHSVTSMMGALAAQQAPGMFGKLSDDRSFTAIHQRSRLCRWLQRAANPRASSIP